MADEKVDGPPIWWVFGFFCWMLLIMYCVNEKFTGRIEGSFAHPGHQWERIAVTEARMNAQGRTLYGPKGPVDSTYIAGKESGLVLNKNLVPVVEFK